MNPEQSTTHHRQVRAQVQEVEAVSRGQEAGAGAGQHRRPPALTTYTCRGWADTPTTILLDTPSRPIGDQLELGVHPLVLTLCRDRV